MLVLKRNFLTCLALLAMSFAGPAPAAGGTILILGDSLSAGYGMRQEEAWPALLQQRLNERRTDYRVVNASISGETTAGGKSRLPALLKKHRPNIVIVALGANDGLRGLPLGELRGNLSRILRLAADSGAGTVLVGMRLPPNFGPYAAQFEAIYRELARTSSTHATPFLLAGIADQLQYFQADTLHPNKDAQPRLLDNVWPALLPLVDAPRRSDAK